MSYPGIIKELMAKLEANGFLYGKPSEKPHLLKKILLGFPANAPSRHLLRRLFSQNYEPGTFSIAERQANPPYIQVDNKSTYEEWVCNEIHSDLERLLPVLERYWPRQRFASRDTETLPQKFLDCLSSQLDRQGTLAEELFQQEYTDFFRRVNTIYLTGWPRLPFNEYEYINDKLLPIGLELARKCEGLDLSMILRISVASGLVGLNHKSSASATSFLYKKGIIPTNFEMKTADIVDETFSALYKKAKEGWIIDNEHHFFSCILNPAKTISLVFFTDDFLESIIDLKFVEKLFEERPDLKITIVPRAVKCGNDADFADILYFFGNRIFSRLSDPYKDGRLQVERVGPISGNVNGLRLSNSVLKLIESSDGILVKGARSYESLQGINKPVFFSYAVCRSQSETVTGVNAESGGLVLIYQNPGEKSFSGYRKRHLRPVIFPSGRKTWLAEQTALDQMEKQERLK